MTNDKMPRGRVLRVIGSADPKTGGPIEALKASSTALLELGWETEVVCLDDPDSAFLSSFPFPITALGSWPLPYKYTPRLSRWMVNNAGRFSAVIIEGLWHHATIGGAIGARRARLPYYVFSHGMMDPFFKRQKPVKHWVKQLYWSALQGPLVASAKAMLFTCEQERQLAHGAFFGQRYREKVVRFGISDVPPTEPSQLGYDRPYLLFLGRIDPKKGCDLLVEAFCSIAGEFGGLDLVIAGPDHAGIQPELQRRVRELGLERRVHWPGMIAGTEKWTTLRNAEAFILPSHQENFGLVVAEAMASGTAALVTKRVNIWQEVVASGGGIAEEDTVAGVRQLLLQWLSMTVEDKMHMRRSARQGYLNYFGIEAAAQDLSELLEQAASEK
ncbi:glycosyltransferase [Rhizobium sp. 21-4511-3d]